MPSLFTNIRNTMPTTIRLNDWRYDKEVSTSSKRKKPSILKATDFTHYRFISYGLKRTFTKQKTVVYSATPDTGTEYVMNLCVSKYPNNLVSNKLLEKIKNQTWSAAVDLAELPETLRFLRDAVVHMYRIWRDLRRGKFRGSLRKMDADTLAALWLAWRYAVMPIVYSVQGATKMWMEPEEQLKEYLVKTHYPVDLDLKAPSGCSWHLRGKLRGVVVYRLVGKRTAARLGFSLSELPSVLWEVTPLSFVVDWILPIGDALAGLSATNNVEFLDGYTSLRFQSVSCTWPDRTVLGVGLEPIIEHASYSAQNASIDYYQRSRLTGFPKPVVRLDPNMNLKRWIDALALVKLIVLKGMK